MPTERVLNRNFKDLLGSTVRFEVPFFQRGYAWERRQWNKLMEDIDEQIISMVEDNNFEDQEHFFGPIVVLEKAHAPHPSLKRFQIIDGQQRITTLYLMLAILRNEFDSKAYLSQEAQKYSAEISALIVNNISNGDDYLRLKVFSSKGDRLPTYMVLFGENPSSPYLPEDQLLYVPGENHIDQFTKYFKKKVKNYDVPALWKMYQSIIQSLKIVWIPLDERKDDPQAIFESLNDAGMPLSAAELLCNYIFKPLINEESNSHEKLHNEKWLKARKIVGSNIFEEYLRDLFSIDERKRVGKNRRMYVHFKSRNKKLDESSAIKYLNDILDYTGIYNNIMQPIKCPHIDSGIQMQLIAIHATNMLSIAPFLMSVLMALHKETLTRDDTLVLLRETYVLLVRRKMASLLTTKYDTFFPSLLKKIINEPDKVIAFQEQVQKEGLWVADQILAEALITRELYNKRELNFSRHVLQEIDKQMQVLKEYPDYTSINTIEHICPQALEEGWIKYLGAEANDINLPRIKNTLGNLCLNSQPANSTFSRKLFEEKQKLLPVVSALARDLKNRKGPWNIAAIQERSKDLAQVALIVWKWNV